jgi:outer membrane protein, heavy metal efflux system
MDWSIPLFALCATSTAAGELEQTLAREARVETMIALALERNPDLAEVRARTRAAEERASAAGRLPDLELKLEPWAVPLARPYAVDEAEMIMIGLRQSFPAPGTLGARERAAREEAKMIAETEGTRARDIVADVRRAYAEYYRVEREYAIHLEHATIASSIVELARANYQSGRGSQEDLLRTIVDLTRLHRDVAHITQERSSSRALLNTLMAREPDAPLGPPPIPDLPIVELDPNQLEAIALRERSELRAAKSGIARAQAGIDGAERAATWPSFMVGADYMLMPTDHEPHRYGAMVSVSLPWLNPQHREELRGAEHALVADRRALESVENGVRYQVHDALARFKAAREAFTITDRDLLPQAEQSFEAARAAFSAGSSSAAGVLDALRILLDVKLQHERARAHWASAFADLERAVGTELHEENRHEHR